MERRTHPRRHYHSRRRQSRHRRPQAVHCCLGRHCCRRHPQPVRCCLGRHCCQMLMLLLGRSSKMARGCVRQLMMHSIGFQTLLRQPQRSGEKSAADEILWRMDDGLKHTTVSTAFSGIDAPGTALEIIRFGVAAKLGLQSPPRAPTHLHAVENFAQSQHELRMHPAGPQCIFRDICEFFVPDVKRIMKEKKKAGTPLTYADMKPSIQSGRAMQRKAYCIVHGKKCEATMAMHHTAGTMCTAFSSQRAHIK